MCHVLKCAMCQKIKCTSIGELKNLDINYHLQSYVLDRSMVFFFNLGGC